MKKTNKLHQIQAGLVFVSTMLVSQSGLSQTFDQIMLTEHNNLRSLHQNTPALTLDTELSAQAKTWAEHLLKIGHLRHGSREQRSGAGENLYFTRQSISTYSQAQLNWMKTHYPNIDIPKPFTPINLAHQAALSWYKELNNYEYPTGTSLNGQAIGHFTQVVWKSSTKLGCGTAHKTEGKMITAYVVCQYAPAGNVRGRYTTNVMPRKPGAMTPE